MPASVTAYIAPVDAIEFLRADHDRIRKLFADFERQLEKRAGDKAEETARAICREVMLHARVEEEIFYPETRAALDDADVVKEAKVEHALANYLIGQIAGGSLADTKFAARVRVLAACMQRHMREEDDVMFVRARSTGLDMGEIGARIAARKHDLALEMDLADEKNADHRSRNPSTLTLASGWRRAS
jgi:hemerythrin superfamily protein